MHVAHLSLRDFRSYAEVDVPLAPGATAFIGPNGQGKTNLVEAVDYLATLTSHRVASDTPLVRVGADSAVVRARVVRDAREALLEVELVPGGSNRARVNRAPLPRVRELLGLFRSVVFSPEDLTLVKGDPQERRRFLDQLLVVRAPRLAGVRADYDRVLRQRNTLLRSAGGSRRPASSSTGESALPTLDAWDAHLARTGAELLAEWLRLVQLLRPLVDARYRDVAAAAPAPRTTVAMTYVPSFPLPEQATVDREELHAAMLAEVASRRGDELDRGVTLVGPHRDELQLGIGDLPARGYASHGESWSLALSLRLAAYDLLRSDGDDPVLVLDDVFAELDGDRRDRLASSVETAEQVLVTAAVAADVPGVLAGARYDVRGGGVRRVH
ncbi:MAG TPA: DNA replication/repair protein RecF [Nocardioidaceae bacterium]|nr:DNA replication/repair protein RecF [Nocardioidaceae bacterium]